MLLTYLNYCQVGCSGMIEIRKLSVLETGLRSAGDENQHSLNHQKQKANAWQLGITVSTSAETGITYSGSRFLFSLLSKYYSRHLAKTSYLFCAKLFFPFLFLSFGFLQNTPLYLMIACLHTLVKKCLVAISGLFIFLPASLFASSGTNLPMNPIGFIQNKGQFDSGTTPSDPRILFKLPGNGMNIYITTAGLSYVFWESSKTPISKEELPAPIQVKWSRVDLGFENARISNENMQIEKKGAENLKYYLAMNHGAEIQADVCKKIRFTEVYPGIDWVMYLNNGEVKYDFEVKPGANPSSIRMKYTGDAKISGNESMQALKIKNALGEISEGKLFCHDASGAAIACQYAIQGELVSIVPAEYNTAKMLVIDPPLVWSTYFGGNFQDQAISITHDNSGNIFLCGFAFGINFPMTPDNFQGTLAGNADAFISKFSNSGVLLWSTYFGGAKVDAGSGLIINAAGDVFVTGNTNSDDLPVLAGPGGAFYQAALGTGAINNVFIAKFSASGNRIWASYMGGTGDDFPLDMEIDAQENIYLVGLTGSSDFPVLNPGGSAYFDGTVSGTRDFFISKFASNGTLLWSTYYGGQDRESGVSLAVDKDNNLYVVGTTASTDFFTKDAGAGAYFQPGFSGTVNDAVILKFNQSGTLLWSTYFGDASGETLGGRVACDSRGKVYVGLITEAPSLILKDLGAGAYYHTTMGGDIFGGTPFMLRFDNQGVLEWATHLQGTGRGGMASIGVGHNDIFYVYGQTRAANFVTLDPGDGSYFQPVNQGSQKYDAFVMEFSPECALRWSTFFGGEDNDYPTDLTVDPQGNIFITGFSRGGTIPLLDPGEGAFYQSTKLPGNGSVITEEDCYIAKFGKSSLELPLANFTKIIACSGDTTFFTDQSAGNPTGWEWTFGDPTSGQQNTSTTQNPWHIYQTGGTYEVQLKATNGGGSNTNTQSLEIIQTVQGQIPNLDSVYCNNHPPIMMIGSPEGGTFAGPGVSGNIFLPKEANPGMNLITYTPPPGTCVKPAEVWVRIKVGDECRSNGLQLLNTEKVLEIFPNPFSTKVNMNLKDARFVGNYQLNLSDVGGKIIWSAFENIATGSNAIQLPQLTTGVYFMHLSSDNYQANLKLICVAE